MTRQNANKEGVSIIGTREIVTTYNPYAGLKFELITFINSNGFIISNANRYRRDYTDRMYLGDTIKICRSKRTNRIKEIHNQSRERLKLYVKHNFKRDQV